MSEEKIFSYKASEAKEKIKECPYCNEEGNILHEHIVVIDTGIRDYILGLGEVEDDE